MKKEHKGYEIGSGNVFADIGVPNADEHFIKAQLVYKIGQIIEARGLTQTAAAKRLGVKQPDISNMMRGQFRQFSVERLMRFLVALNHDVEIVVREHHDKRSDPSLHVALAAY
jgi:predicted XRE-type DNA-binding protein